MDKIKDFCKNLNPLTDLIDFFSIFDNDLLHEVGFPELSAMDSAYSIPDDPCGGVWVERTRSPKCCKYARYQSKSYFDQ